MRAIALSLMVLALPIARAEESEVDWPDGAFNPYARLPIRIYFDLTNLSDDTTARYAEGARAALVWWEKGGNGALAWTPDFEETPDIGRADIRVWFNDTAFACGYEHASGCGGFGGPQHPGIVELAMRVPRAGGEFRLDDRPIPYRALTEVAKHEVGHAIGLPHSNARTDIMFPEADSAAWHGEAPDTSWAVRNIGSLMIAFIVVAGLTVWLVPYAPWRRRREKW